MVTERFDQQHLVVRRVPDTDRRDHVLRVAVGIAAVPQDLNQRDPQRVPASGRDTTRFKQREERVEVDAARQERRCSSSPGTPSTARVHSFEIAVAAPPKIPPWLLPL